MKKKEEDVSFIIYDSPSPPLLVRTKRSAVNNALHFFPLLTLIILVISSAAIFYWRWTSISPAMSKPQTIIKVVGHPKIKELTAEVETLKAKLAEFSTSTASSVAQVQKTPSIAIETAPIPVPTPIIKKQPTENSFLPLFELPENGKNLSGQKWILIQNVNYQLQNSTIKLTFDLLNNRQDKQKITGHIFVLLYHPFGIEISHGKGAKPITQKITFNWGEKFSTERFRPSQAIFTKPLRTNDLIFRIVVFSLEGSILADEKVEGKI